MVILSVDKRVSLSVFIPEVASAQTVDLTLRHQSGQNSGYGDLVRLTVNNGLIEMERLNSFPTGRRKKNKHRKIS